MGAAFGAFGKYENFWFKKKTNYITTTNLEEWFKNKRISVCWTSRETPGHIPVPNQLQWDGDGLYAMTHTGASETHYSKHPRWLQNCSSDLGSASFYCKTDSRSPAFLLHSTSFQMPFVGTRLVATLPTSQSSFFCEMMSTAPALSIGNIGGRLYCHLLEGCRHAASPPWPWGKIIIK